MNKEDIMSGKVCPYCLSVTQLIDSSLIYHGVSYGLAYQCLPCNAYVGCHKGTNVALGRLANKELREAKKKAHAAFDPIWKEKVQQGANKKKARGEAYSWLSEQLGIPTSDCHIGMMDIEDCNKILKICANVHSN